MQNTYWRNNKDEQGLLLKNIPLILFKRVCAWEGVGDRTELQHIEHPLLWPSALCLSRSPGLLNRRPRVQLSAGCWLSVPHLVTKLSDSKLTDFLFSPSYIIVQSPTQYLWNGMFDCHQAEITVMRFTSHSLPVHQSMTVPWGFTSSHIVSQARLRYFFP